MAAYIWLDTGIVLHPKPASILSSPLRRWIIVQGASGGFARYVSTYQVLHASILPDQGAAGVMRIIHHRPVLSTGYALMLIQVSCTTLTSSSYRDIAFMCL